MYYKVFARNYVVLYSTICVPHNPVALYRVTIQVVQSLPLTSKQKFRFIEWASYKTETFVLMSTEGFAQPDWSPCTSVQ